MWIYKCKINFYKCKITFYKCKLTCDKKLCQVIHSRSEISWKKPKKWIFGFLKFALPVPLPWALKSWAPSNFILSDTFPIFFWGGKLKKQIYFLQGTWGLWVLKFTILVKTHIFEVKFRPNEGRQPGHTRPQQVGWWSTWSDLDLEFDLEILTGRNRLILQQSHVNVSRYKMSINRLKPQRDFERIIKKSLLF